MSSCPNIVDTDGSSIDFDRLRHRTIRGGYRPSLPELLQGFPFYRNDLSRDAGDFARRIIGILTRQNDPNGNISAAMARLTASHEVIDFRLAAAAIESSPEMHLDGGFGLIEDAGRCWFYAAVCGDQDAVRTFAVVASKVQVVSKRLGPSLRQFKGVIAWALAAAGVLQLPTPWTIDAADRFINSAATVTGDLGEVVMQYALHLAKTGNLSAKLETPHQSETTTSRLSRSGTSAHTETGAIVFNTIGNRDTAEGKRVLKSFRPVLGQPLRLAPTPDLASVRAALAREFPHAASVAEQMLSSLQSANTVHFSPTILVGPPGCGKTTFSIRLSELLGAPFEVFPCVAVSDAAVSGTSRRWSSGEPSLPVSVIRSTGCANPVIILDEIEKASTSRQNGCMLDALLTVWEPRTARAWRDPYIEAPCDVSRVNWLGTANDFEGTPRALRDRCRVIRFPAPSRKHLASLAAGMLLDLEQTDPRWIRPIQPSELRALQATWKDGSLRSLTRLMKSVIETRRKFDARH